jgi:hypothetical protein
MILIRLQLHITYDLVHCLSTYDTIMSGEQHDMQLNLTERMIQVVKVGPEPDMIICCVLLLLLGSLHRFAISIPNTLLQRSIHLAKLLKQRLANVIIININQRPRNIAVQVLAILLIELDLVELARLLKVDVALDLALVVLDLALNLGLSKSARLLNNVHLIAELVGEIRARPLVAQRLEVAVAVPVGDGAEGAVDGHLLVVGADAVAGGVVVGVQARLQHGVVRGLPARDHVGRAEVRLLDFGKVVFGVLGEDHAADVVVGDVQPVLCQVQDVVAVVLRFFFGHGRDGDFPGRVVALFDGVEKILGRPGVVLAGVLLGLGVGEVAHALLGLQFHAGVNRAAVVLHKAVGVTRPSVHVPETVGRAEVGQQTEELEDGFGELGRPCPECVPVTRVGCGIGLLGVDEPGELERVADEEDGGVWGRLLVI